MSTKSDQFLNSLISSVSWSCDWIKEPHHWVGHMPFAYWLMEEIQPKVFVELGTHSANSYFSFCQAVRDRGLTSRCYAVDTWKGDEHAGFYGEEVFDMVNRHNESQYKSFSTLYRMTFDEALGQFQDGSVDLLHIDGFHTYEAVRHDFEEWLPKLAPGCLVLFHDIIVTQGEFGVYRLWAELRQKYLENFEFKHGGGLGVIQIPISNSTKEDKRTWLREGTAEKKKLFEVMSAIGESLAAKVRGQQLERSVSMIIANNGQTEGERLLNVELFFAQEGQIFSKEQKISKLILFRGNECIRFRILLHKKAAQAALWRIDPGNQIGEIDLLEMRFFDQKGSIVWNLQDHRQEIVVGGTAVQHSLPKVGLELFSVGADPIILLPPLPHGALPICFIELSLRIGSLSERIETFAQLQNRELKNLQVCLAEQHAQNLQLESILERKKRQIQEPGAMDAKFKHTLRKMADHQQDTKRFGKKIQEARTRIENHNKDLQKSLGRVQQEIKSKFRVLLADLDKRNTVVRQKIQCELDLIQSLISVKHEQLNQDKKGERK